MGCQTIEIPERIPGDQKCLAFRAGYLFVDQYHRGTGLQCLVVVLGVVHKDNVEIDAINAAVRVLQASGDPRAGEVLANAHTMLQERAARIDDEELRRSYLENVPYHREIMEEWANRPQRDPPA